MAKPSPMRLAKPESDATRAKSIFLKRVLGRRAEGRPSAAPLESLDLAGRFAACRWRQQVDEKLSKKTVTVPAGVTVTWNSSLMM